MRSSVDYQPSQEDLSNAMRKLAIRTQFHQQGRRVQQVVITRHLSVRKPTALGKSLEQVWRSNGGQNRAWPDCRS